MNESVDLESIRRQIAALPERLRIAGDDVDETPAKGDGPLAVIARQGRLILRLTAAAEATESRLKTLTEQTATDRASITEAQEAARKAEEETRRITREALLPLMDALDWVSDAARVRGDSTLAESLSGARRDGLRRLAAVGITEIPAGIGGAFDGRLHEAVEARPAPLGSPLPRYSILAVVRPGYQRGTEILRRTTVITVE